MNKLARNLKFMHGVFCNSGITEDGLGWAKPYLTNQ